VTAKETPVGWLERRHGEPDAFKYPVYEEIHTPYGLFQVKADHIGDCRCETGEGEFWTQVDTVMKWRSE
jgi:hypothetical protein